MFHQDEICQIDRGAAIACRRIVAAGIIRRVDRHHLPANTDRIALQQEANAEFDWLRVFLSRFQDFLLCQEDNVPATCMPASITCLICVPCEPSQKKQIMNTFQKLGLVLAIAGLFVIIPSCEVPYRVTTSVQYTNPPWAPSYHPGARYYYFPDIEVYYDLPGQEFVYLHNGQWMFSPTMPSLYVGFDLYTAYIITLNVQVYQPWLHHHYYVAHYPRYYYHNTYQRSLGTVRGFNENLKKPVFWRDGEKDKAKDLRNTKWPIGNPPVQSAPQNTNYYGKTLGQPVKVKPQMKGKKKELE